MRENPVFSQVLKNFVQEKQLKKQDKNSRIYYALRNKVLRNIEIFDFVIFRDGSYYSLFTGLDKSRVITKNSNTKEKASF